MTITKERIIELIQKNREQIRNFGVKKLTLIGSFAKGNYSDHSDIDILVEFEEKRGLFDDFVHLNQFLEDLFERKVDLGDENLIRDELKPNILDGEKVEARI